MRDVTAKRLSRLHTIVYRATGGRIGRRLVHNDMLLLTTSGRRSGRRHTVPLLYLPDGADVIVVASWGGRDYAPDWYHNLTADPQVAVRVDGMSWPGIAQAMPEPERREWWSRVVAAYDGYERYQSQTVRVIPLIRISPIHGS